MTKTDEKKTKILSKNLFPVVGIGASAGGLEAFKTLVKAIPEKSGMAYILVQHLYPGHESLLPEILQRATKIPVLEIKDNVHVEPDKIYVIPSNKILVATDGVLQLSPRSAKGTINLPIDIFFSSLAEVHQSHSIGVILSGTGSDGTAGLKDIKNHGGATFAQEPDTANYKAMPQHAIDAEIIDFILPIEQIPERLMELRRYFPVSSAEEQNNVKNKFYEEIFSQILGMLRVRAGVDFSFYKQSTVRRRIVHRTVTLKLGDISNYLEYLGKNKPELDMLFNDLLISVTSFFRDPAIFTAFSKKIIPRLIKAGKTENSLRLWVAGCSTGQEAYSIAMCLIEYLSKAKLDIKVQIFATDISERSIDKARSGIYSKKELSGVSTLRLARFFTRIDGHYRVIKPLRESCIFAVQNFLKDPPFANLDFISCRNVLIYFEPFLQKKAFSMFQYSLNTNGILWLGQTESAGSSSELFSAFNNNDKFFIRKAVTGTFRTMVSERHEKAFREKDNVLPADKIKTDDFKKSAEDVLLAEHTPPGVIVNDQMDIVQFRGATRDYLEPSPGKASLNILKMAKAGLTFDLRNALHKAKITGKPFIKQGIVVSNATKKVNIEVIPLLNLVDPYFLILFKEGEAVAGSQLTAGKKQLSSGKNDVKNIRIALLERKLKQVLDDMAAITEDQESINDQLQSSNEELLSGTEELQSLNEELETSKEEMESTNEELITVNQELYDINQQLSHSRNFAQGIISTLHESLLVMDKNLYIKSANKSFYKHFRVQEKEILEKNLFEMQNKSWDVPVFRRQMTEIQKAKELMTEAEITFTFPLLGERSLCCNIQPLNRENEEHLILLALDDISERKKLDHVREAAARQVKQSEENLRLILESLPQITLTLSPAGSVTFYNKYFLDYTGLNLKEAERGGIWQNIIHPDDIKSVVSDMAEAVTNGTNFYKEIRMKRNEDNMYRWHIAKAIAIKEGGVITSWVGSATDIHDHKMKEQLKDDFIGIASHEMKTPITTIKAYLQMLEMDLQADKAYAVAYDYAKKASHSVSKLNDLITELLDVSKMQAGTLTYCFDSFDFTGMVSSTVQDMELISPGRLTIRPFPAALHVFGDRSRLQQVVINLLSNAIKYSPEKSKIMLQVKLVSGMVTLSVKDKGIGIPAKNLKKVFDKYFRVESTALHFQGLGIGLFISFQIIHRHKGKLWVESVEGKGSTFYFSIPVAGS